MEPLSAPFHVLMALNQRSGRDGNTPTSVVIHCTDAENPASSTAKFFHTVHDVGSTHAVVDDNQGWTCVLDENTAAGAPPFNATGLHIEQSGRASRTRGQWLLHLPTIERCAFHVARWCHKFDIPVKLLHTADLVAQGIHARGITYHAAVTNAFHQSTHTDPGPNYPFDVFMDHVKSYYGGGTGGGGGGGGGTGGGGVVGGGGHGGGGSGRGHGERGCYGG